MNKYAVVVIRKGKIVKYLVNGKIGKFVKTVELIADTVNSAEMKIAGETITDDNGMCPMENQIY